MAELQKLEKHAKTGILMEAELELVLEVIKMSAGGDLDGMAGTFILDAQENGRDAECLLRFNFPKGSYTSTTCYAVGTRQSFSRSRTSESLAEESIDAVLEWPRMGTFPELDQLYHSNAKQILTGIYTEDEHAVLVLNAARGRFLISARILQQSDLTSSEGYAQMLMYLVAQALGLMRPDNDLQRSLEKLSRELWKLGCYGAWLDELVAVEQGLLPGRMQHSVEPGFMAWRKWRKEASAQKKSLKYFE